ncbi:uncharacterized protein LOC115624358 isoform X2 [Scaptodrosophila lebanonensis]|nr:uncharacterized protein LOC115624358 isoform X2 [Scaptodrosophila lebanonensis]
MRRQDWIKFYKWAMVNAQPVEFVLPPEEHHSERPRAQCSEETLVKPTSLATLSTPRWPRQKVEPSCPQDYPYRPVQSAKNLRPRRPEPTRPVCKPVVPCCFQHEELEADFWSELRFPVSKRAQHATASKRIVKLAKPKQYPTKPLHEQCIPKKEEVKMPKRKRMNSRQWRDHQQRLQYLSKPNARVLAELAEMYGECEEDSYCDEYDPYECCYN